MDRPSFSKSLKLCALRFKLKDRLSFNKSFTLFDLRFHLSEASNSGSGAYIHLKAVKTAKLLRQVVLRSPPACLRGTVGGFFTSHFPARLRYEVFLGAALCA
jgi:hypothetical protein